MAPSSPQLEGPADVDRLLSKCTQLSQRYHVQNQRNAGELEALRAEIESVLESIRFARQQVAGLSDARERAAQEERLAECDQLLRSGPGGDMASLLKRRRRPLILTILLGKQLPLHTVLRKDVFNLKREYHTFRARVAQAMLVLAALLIAGMWQAENKSSWPETPLLRAVQGALRYSFSPLIMFGVQVFLVFMVYVYTSMAAREGVLLLNGSRIRHWWLWHHYLSAATCVITLTLPVDSPAVQRFVEGWLHWTVAQAALMLAQNQYQQKRMYARVALGKASSIDIVGGETSGMPGQLLALLPFLFLLQAWQLYMGANMMRHSAPAMVNPEGWLDFERRDSDLRGMRGVFVVGLLMAVMGLMNAKNTVSTIQDKRRISRRMRARVAQAK
eukprot:jgi/Ulvmu1/1335/UM011_0063.1